MVLRSTIDEARGDARLQVTIPPSSADTESIETSFAVVRSIRWVVNASARRKRE
jgi:hypothetical protein